MRCPKSKKEVQAEKKCTVTNAKQRRYRRPAFWATSIQFSIMNLSMAITLSLTESYQGLHDFSSLCPNHPNYQNITFKFKYTISCLVKNEIQ